MWNYQTKSILSAIVGNLPLEPPPGVRVRVPDSTPFSYVYCCVVW
jgi:hypothetical protein